MKKILIPMLVLIFASNIALSQNKNAKPTKAKPAAVDCSKVDDAKITEDVKATFAAAPSLKDQSISVATSGGVVTLTGSVKKGNQKGMATIRARRVPCVQKVDNQITVEGAAPKNTNSPNKTSKNTAILTQESLQRFNAAAANRFNSLQATEDRQD